MATQHPFVFLSFRTLLATHGSRQLWCYTVVGQEYITDGWTGCALPLSGQHSLELIAGSSRRKKGQFLR